MSLFSKNVSVKAQTERSAFYFLLHFIHLNKALIPVPKTNLRISGLLFRKEEGATYLKKKKYLFK